MDEEAKPQLTEQSFDGKLAKLAALDAQIDDLKEKVKALNQEYDDIHYEVVQFMLQTDCKGKKILGKNFILTSRTFAKIEDPTKFEQWVEDNDAWKLVMQRSPSKINAFVKEAMEVGEAIPDGVTPGYVENYIQIRQG